MVRLHCFCRLFLVELSFVGNLVVWLYTRLYLYPVRVIWQGVWRGAREVCLYPGAPGTKALYAPAGSWAAAGFPAGKDHKLGDGSFSLVKSILTVMLVTSSIHPSVV